MASGGLAGFAAGVAWAVTGLPAVGPAGALVIVTAAVAADLVATRAPAVRALSVRRQVPTAWSSLFAPETVGLLYGARLGVGPLTILPTWLWWAAMVLGASAGPWAGAVTGAVFAAARATTTLLAAEVTAGDAARRMGRLIAVGRPSAPVIALAALLVGAAAFARGA